MGLQTECWRLREEVKALHAAWEQMCAEKNDQERQAEEARALAPFVFMAGTMIGTLLCWVVSRVCLGW